MQGMHVPIASLAVALTPCHSNRQLSTSHSFQQDASKLPSHRTESHPISNDLDRVIAQPGMIASRNPASPRRFGPFLRPWFGASVCLMCAAVVVSSGAFQDPQVLGDIKSIWQQDRISRREVRIQGVLPDLDLTRSIKHKTLPPPHSAPPPQISLLFLGLSILV